MKQGFSIVIVLCGIGILILLIFLTAGLLAKKLPAQPPTAFPKTQSSGYSQ